MSDFTIRPMQPSDESFIYKAWLEGYWPHFPGNVVMTKSEFLTRWHRVIQRILADPRTKTVVAHIEGKPDSLMGFACGSDRCLHWAYVKQAFRKLGIGAKCVEAIFPNWFTMISHWPGDLGGGAMVYAPELLKDYT